MSTCLLTGSLLPGTLVNARVKAVLSDGLQMSFCTYFTGTVDPFHLGQVCCCRLPSPGGLRLHRSMS
jgi:hypothetical protein